MPEYIERETAIAWFMPYVHAEESIDADVVIADIKGMKAADVAPVRHGEWQGEGDGYADGEIVLDVWYCSECGYCIDDGTDDPHILPNYCPNCGAKMDLEGKHDP